MTQNFRKAFNKMVLVKIKKKTNTKQTKKRKTVVLKLKVVGSLDVAFTLLPNPRIFTLITMHMEEREMRGE